MLESDPSPACVRCHDSGMEPTLYLHSSVNGARRSSRITFEQYKTWSAGGLAPGDVIHTVGSTPCACGAVSLSDDDRARLRCESAWAGGASAAQIMATLTHELDAPDRARLGRMMAGAGAAA